MTSTTALLSSGPGSALRPVAVPQQQANNRVWGGQVFEKRCKHIIFVSTVSLVQFLPEVTAARPVPSRSEPRHEAGWRVCTTSSLPTRCAKCRTHGAGSFLRAAWA